jgi:hypothetical protein
MTDDCQVAVGYATHLPRSNGAVYVLSGLPTGAENRPRRELAVHQSRRWMRTSTRSQSGRGSMVDQTDPHPARMSADDVRAHLCSHGQSCRSLASTLRLLR